MNIIGYLKIIDKFYYKFGYFLLTVLIDLFFIKYFYSFLFYKLVYFIKPYLNMYINLIEFLIFFLFVLGNIFFVLNVFYKIVRTFNINNYDLIDRNLLFIIGTREKFYLCYGYMWILIGYVFIFNTNSIKELIDKNEFNIMQIIFILISIITFFIFIKDSIIYLSNPLFANKLLKTLLSKNKNSFN